MGKKTSLTALHLGINKTTSFLSVETFSKDLRLSLLKDILFIAKLRVGWRPLSILVKNKRFPHREPFLYTLKYFYHSIKITKSCNKIEIVISIWDVTTNRKAKKTNVKISRRTLLLGRIYRNHFRKPLFSIAENVYEKFVKNLEVKVVFQEGSFWLKKLYKLEVLKNKTDLERYRVGNVTFGYVRQKEFKFFVRHRAFGFLMQCFLYAIYKLNANLLLKLFCKILSKVKKKDNKGRRIIKHFVKMVEILPFFFRGKSIGLTIFLKGRLHLSFRKKSLRISFGAIRRNTFDKSISESTGKVLTRFGVFTVRILMSKKNPK